jgi:hypothetical protein
MEVTMATATQIDTDMFQWADGTRHYRTSDGLDFAIEATILAEDTPIVPTGAEPMVAELIEIIGAGRAPLKRVVRPTVMFECTETGAAVSLTPVHTFPAGTTYEEALAQAGYTV